MRLKDGEVSLMAQELDSTIQYYEDLLDQNGDSMTVKQVEKIKKQIRYLKSCKKERTV